MNSNKLIRLVLSPNENSFISELENGAVYHGSMDNSQLLPLPAAGDSPVIHIAFSHDGSLLTVSTKSGKVTVWDVKSALVLCAFKHQCAVHQCEPISKDSYITVDEWRCGLLWKKGPQGFSAVPISHQIDACAALPEHNEIVYHDNFNLAVWSIEKEQEIRAYAVMDSWYLDQLSGELKLSKNGRYFFIYWDEGMVFDTETGKLAYKFPASYYPPSSINVSDSGRRTAVGTYEGTFAVMEKGRGVLLEKEFDGEVVFSDMTPDGRLVSCLDENGAGGIYAPDTGKVLLDSGKIYENLKHL